MRERRKRRRKRGGYGIMRRKGMRRGQSNMAAAPFFFPASSPYPLRRIVIAHSSIMHMLSCISYISFVLQLSDENQYRKTEFESI